MADHTSNSTAVQGGRGTDRSAAKAYLVGGGIASLAAAAFLIRDGDIPGHDITILEELDMLGGSLDGAGSPEDGYVLRGGRMLESKYLCTFDLFASIPTLDGSRTVTQEIFAWNETMKTSSKSRLVPRRPARDRARSSASAKAHILTIERLALEPEAMLGRTQHRRPVRRRVLHDRFLVHVVHDLRLPALAQRGRIQALSGALRPHGRRLRPAARASCGRSTTSTIRWCGRCRNGSTSAASSSS